MKKLTHPATTAALLMITLFSLCMLSCKKDGDEVTHLVVVDSFSGIVLHDNVQLEIFDGPDRVVKVTGHEYKRLDFEVKGGKLHVSGNGSGLLLQISHPALNRIEVHNDARLEFMDDYETDGLEIHIHDAGRLYSMFHLVSAETHITLHNAAKLALKNITAVRLNIDMKDGSRCDIQGFAEEQHITVRNGSRFNLEFPEAGWTAQTPVQGERVWVDAHDGAAAWVFAKDELNVQARHGSRIYYKGEPADIDADLTDGAELIKREF